MKVKSVLLFCYYFVSCNAMGVGTETKTRSEF